MSTVDPDRTQRGYRDDVLYTLISTSHATIQTKTYYITIVRANDLRNISILPQ